MITNKDIDEMLYLKNIIQREGAVHKHCCSTRTLIYLRCLTELGILRRVEGQGNIVYWEFIK